MLYKRNQTWSANLNLLANHLFFLIRNDNVIDKVLPKFHKDPIENQKAKGECNIVNILNVFLAKYSYSNIDGVTM